MKRIFFLGFILTFGTLFLFSQPPQGGRQRVTIEERAKRITEWMVTELSLTEDQVAPVDSINLLFTKTQQILLQAADGDREKIREAMTALETEKTEALAKVLTSEQLENYKKKSSEMKNQRNSGRRGRR